MSKLHLIFRLGLGLAVPVAMLGACGGDDPSAPTGETQAPCPAGFLPLTTGSTWKYFVRDVSSTSTSMKETTVEGREPVPRIPSVMAFKVTTKKGIALRDQTVSWQDRVGTQVQRYQETSYKPGTAGAAPTEDIVEWWSPYKLRLDESADKLRKSMSWKIDYMETAIEAGAMTTRARSETWTVVGVNEEVTVLKGTYKALHVHRAGAPSAASGEGSDKHYWFACGVGKVKETGGQTEELTDFTIAP
jgi:hypothetical protein